MRQVPYVLHGSSDPNYENRKHIIGGLFKLQIFLLQQQDYSTLKSISHVEVQNFLYLTLRAQQHNCNNMLFLTSNEITE